MEGPGSALKVGIAVVVAVLMVVSATAFINSEFLQRGRTYYVFGRFENALGISDGMVVKLAGTNVGKVEEFGLSEDGSYTSAKISIDDAITLYRSDEFVITQESLLGGSFISIDRKSEEQRLDENGKPVSARIAVVQNAEEVLVGRRQGGFNEIMQQTSDLIVSVEGLLGDDSLGGAINTITNRLDTTLAQVEELIESSSVLFDENSDYITSSMKNVNGITANFLVMSRNLEEASVSLKALADDPNNTETISSIMTEMKDTSASLNHMMAQVDSLISDPAVQQDAKDSVRLTKETLEEAKATMERFQETLDGVDGLMETATEVMDDAGGAVNEAKAKMEQFDEFGEAIEVRTHLSVRGVDVNDDGNLNNSDITVGDINAAVGYRDAYVLVGADNIGESNDANFMFGYGALNGFSMRGGVYRGELGFGGAYYLPGGGGAELTWYDTEDPKFNAFGFIPIGDKFNVVVGVEDIENDAKPSVGVGVEL